MPSHSPSHLFRYFKAELSLSALTTLKACLSSVMGDELIYRSAQGNTKGLVFKQHAILRQHTVWGLKLLVLNLDSLVCLSVCVCILNFLYNCITCDLGQVTHSTSVSFLFAFCLLQTHSALGLWVRTWCLFGSSCWSPQHQWLCSPWRALWGCYVAARAVGIFSGTSYSSD